VVKPTLAGVDNASVVGAHTFGVIRARVIRCCSTRLAMATPDTASSVTPINTAIGDESRLRSRFDERRRERRRVSDSSTSGDAGAPL